MAFVGSLLCSLQPTSAPAHAGHDHAPEVEAPRMPEIAPRFYAVTDALQGVLVFPKEDAQSTAAVLYLTEHISNQTVANAEVTVDILSGPETSIQVTSGPVSGSYTLGGLVASATTTSLMVDVTNGQLSDIITFDNVVISQSKTLGEDATVSLAENALKAAGLPTYVWHGLIAIHAILVFAVIAALLSWAFGRRRRPPPAAATLAFLAITSLAFSHSGDPHDELTSTSAGPLPGSSQHFVAIETQFSGDIQTSEVRRQTLPTGFRALGQVEIRADRRAIVTPPAEGRLVRPATREKAVPVLGDHVRQGEVLVILEQIIPAAEKVTLTTDRSQVEAELRVAEQELAVAARDLQRSERLGGVISAQELERARADLRIAQDRVTGLQNRLKTLTSAISEEGPGVREIPIVAPITGFVTKSHAVAGEYVRTDKELFEIISVDEVLVGADVFETDLPKVQGATQARITLEAYPREFFTGTLHAISQEIDPQTRSAHVLFALSNPDGKLRGGMFANIEIETGGEREVLTIPRSALFSRDGIRQVFKKVAPEVFAAQPVQTTEFRSDYAVVQGDLKPGDLLAISGLYQVRMSPVLDE